MKKVNEFLFEKGWLVQIIIIFTIILVIFFSLSWTTSPNHYFFADDWAWLYRAEFFSFKELFNVLPTWIYNDRPVGAIVIKIIYSIFGLDNVAFHTAILGIHLVNTVLVYLISSKILKSKSYGLFLALTYGIFMVGLNAVFWVAAIFDLFGHTLFLLTFYLYLLKNKWLKYISLSLFFLAIRTKEMTITLPLFLTTYELATILPNYSWKRIFQIIKQQYLYYVIMTFMLSWYLFLSIKLDVVIEKTDPYYQSVTITDFIQGVGHYLSRLSSLDWEPQYIFAIFAFILLVHYISKNKMGVFGGIAFLISILPVVFLKNQRNDLYLYIPMFYFLIFIFASCQKPLDFTINKLLKSKKRKNVALFFVLSLSYVGFHRYIFSSQKTKNIISYYVQNMEIYKESLHSVISEVPEVEEESTFFINNLPKYYNVFDYGPGYSLRILYKDDSINTEIYQTEEELIKKYKSVEGNKYWFEYSRKDRKLEFIENK